VDDISKLLGGLEGAGVSGGPAQSIGGLAEAVRESGGLDGLLGKLKAGGLGDVADSWVGTGSNQPVEPQALGAALGPDTVSNLSAKSGLDIATLLPILAAFLPQIIDMLTPDGAVPSGGLNSAASAVPGDIGGLLGGLLGGSGGAGGADLAGMLGGLLGSDMPG
jgi:uncharacterized protein YidB (DUF937 family)